MHAQFSAGIRGLECGYRALGIILGDYVERPEPAVLPAGWEPDMPAFYCGLDPTTKELTPKPIASRIPVTRLRMRSST